MDILQNIDPNIALIGAVCCAGLCIFGGFLTIGLQFLGTFIEIVGGFVGLLFDILLGGPFAWCGCLLLLVACGACAAFVAGMTTCGTPQQIMICKLLGY